MIDRRRQQQAVLAIETLRIAAVPPGLAVTRAQVLDAFDARDATAPLDLPNPLLEQALTATRENQGGLLGGFDGTVVNLGWDRDLNRAR